MNAKKAKTSKTAAKPKTTKTAAKGKKKTSKVKKKSSKGSVVKIVVSLNLANQPNVVLKTLNGSNARKMTASSGDTIEWRKKDSTSNFEMHDFSPTGLGEAFQNKSINPAKTKLTCEYTPTSTDPNAEFKYTLTVNVGKQTYDTTKPPAPGPDGGRPVIRN